MILRASHVLLVQLRSPLRISHLTARLREGDVLVQTTQLGGGAEELGVGAWACVASPSEARGEPSWEASL